MAEVVTDDQQVRLEQAAAEFPVTETYIDSRFTAKNAFLAGAAWMKADTEANRDLTVEYLVGYSQGKVDEAKRVLGLVEALKACSPAWLPPAVRDMRREALRSYDRGDT